MKKFFVVLFCLGFASQLLAITDEEIFRSISLNLSTPGARARAMGGAFIGRADDATAAVTNPAGLSILVKPEVSLEYRYQNPQTFQTNVVQVPVQPGYDITPSPIFPPDPGQLDEPVVAEFHSSDTLEHVSELGFFSVVYPISGLSLAFSRFELINTNATVSGDISSSPFHYVERNGFSGAVDVSDVNYGFSASFKLGHIASVGGTLNISDFSFDSNIGAFQKDETQLGAHFRTIIDQSDNKLGFNVGVLVHPSHKISLGAVYRYEPEYTLTVNVINTDFGGSPLIRERSGLSEVKFDIPDQVGVGVSLAPTQNVTVNLDVVRILYSQLEPVETGYSLFTHLLPIFKQADQINFAVDDKTDVHVGAEYLATTSKYVWAFRGGYYHQGRNRFFLANAANPDISSFLEPIFGNNPGPGINHITTGTGITAGNFSLDFAADFNIKSEQNSPTKGELADPGFQLIISSVFRF